MNVFRTFTRVAPLCLAALAAGNRTVAADSTWTGLALDALWTNPDNWTGASIPGSTTPVTGTDTGNLDVATFNHNLNTVITLDAYRNLKSLVFTPGSDAYVLESGTLALSSGGSVIVAGGVTASQTIAGPVTFVPAATAASFVNNSLNAGVGLNLSGAISGSRSAGSTVLTLGGVNGGNITGTIVNGGAGGNVSVTKAGAGTWVLSAANTFSGGISVNAGNLVLDYATASSLAAATNALTMGGGTLTVKGRTTGSTTQTLGSLTLTTAKGFSVITVDKNGGSGTNLTLGNTWTRNSGASILFDLSSGGVVTSSPVMAGTSGAEKVIIGAGTGAGFLVKDETGKTDYATRSAGNQIVRLETSGTVLAYETGSPLAVTTKNYTIKNDTTLTAGTNTFGTLRVDSWTNPVTVTLGANHLGLGKSVMVVDGSHDVLFTSGVDAGKFGEGSFILETFNTATTTIAARIGSVAGISASFVGPGLVVLNYDNSGQNGATTLQSSVVRLANAKALPTGQLTLQNGAILELGAADFARSVGTNLWEVQFTSGSAGFSAFGAPRTANLGGSSAELTWASGSFLSDGSSLILGSRVSDNTLTFTNALNLNNGNRVVHVNDGVNTGNVDAVISGVISSTVPASGILTKTGAGTLALSGNNTYAGGTNILEGQLIIGNGSATGALSDAGVVYNNGTLAFNRTNTYTNNGVIVGAGQVKQIGLGRTILAGLNSYTGPTTVVNGTLSGTGSAASDLIVQAAKLAPGVDTGTFYAANATFNPESTYHVEVDGESADKLQATGSITLAGALTVTPLTGGFSQPSYVIAQGGSITGTFSSVTYGYKVTYTATQAILSEVPTYYTWADEWAPGQTEHQDHDGDGVSNGLEYFMGQTGSATTILPGAISMDGVVSVTWPKANTFHGVYGVDYVVQTSTNLQPEGQPGGWAPAPVDTIDDALNYVSVSFPADVSRYFARLKVFIPEYPFTPPPPPSKIPPTPRGVAMAANSPNSITLSWYSSPINDDAASGYNIYASTALAGPYNKVGTSVARTFTHEGLASDAKLYYKVTATNVVGESAKSADGEAFFTFVRMEPASLPVRIAKNMCVTLGATIVSNVAPSLGSLAHLVDGSDATGCAITGANEVRIKLNTTLSIEDAEYLLLNFRSDTTRKSLAYNVNWHALKDYVIKQSIDSTNGVDGTWTEVVSGSNPYLDGVVVIPTPAGSPKPKWIGIQNSGSIEMCRLEIFRGAPEGYHNDYWIFAGDSLVVQDMAGGSPASHTVWFSDLVRQRHPDRYPIMVTSAAGGTMLANTIGQMTNALPYHCAPNGTSTPTATFLCMETGFNDVGAGGGLWMGPSIFIPRLLEAQQLCNSYGMFLVPVRVEFSTKYLNLDTLEAAGSWFNTLAPNLSGVDAFARKYTPYACDPVTQMPYADYWTYTRQNYATALSSDGVHHTKAGSDGINTLWADVADKMVYLKEQ